MTFATGDQRPQPGVVLGRGVVAGEAIGDALGGAAGGFVKNWYVNAVTGGIGGGVKLAGYVGRQAIEIAAETGIDVARGGEFGSSLAYNAVGSVVGEAIGDALGAGVRAFRRNFEISFDSRSVDLGAFGGGLGGFRVSRRVSVPRNTGGLGDATTSPWLNDTRIGVRSHIESFRDGGSYLVPQSTYENWIRGQATIGRPDGQFITTRAGMDRLIREAGGDLGSVKRRLGIPDEYWNEPLFRVDIDHPLLHNARLPAGWESGANELFQWGGYTSGGLPEVIIDQIPAGGFRVIPTGIRP